MGLSDREIIDTFTDLDWGVKKINAPEIWKKTKGQGVKVTLIDTGIDLNHPDLKRSFAGGMNMLDRARSIQDYDGHGTHLAGLLTGEKTGVAPDAELHVIKSLDDSGRGTFASVLDGITYAMNIESDIISMSLGRTDTLPVIIQQRLYDAYHKGITIVSASGNGGGSAIDFPARMDEVIAVGGINKDLVPSSFSNHGKELDLVAPSEWILSTYKDSNYARMTGTSIASPLVAGGIALIISHYKKQGIQLNSYDITKMIHSYGEHSYSFGYGIFDIEKMMEYKFEK